MIAFECTEGDETEIEAISLAQHRRGFVLTAATTSTTHTGIQDNQKRDPLGKGHSMRVALCETFFSFSFFRLYLTHGFASRH